MAARAGAKRKDPPPAPENPGPKHNQTPVGLTQDEMDDLFIVHLAQARADNDVVENAMNIVRGVKKTRTRNRTLARTDGFPLKQMDEILADELLSRHDVEEREAIRQRMRGIAQQPGGNMIQADLFRDSFAQADKDDAYWAGLGLTAGLRGLEQDPSKYEVPQERWQLWLENWHEGQKKLAKAWETKTRIERGEARTQEKDPGEEAHKILTAEEQAEWDAANPAPAEQVVEEAAADGTAPVAESEEA